MNITSVNNIARINQPDSERVSMSKDGKNSAFDDMYQAAVNLLNETNDYSKAAQESEISYALGITDNVHNVIVAQQKANLSLQYTVAIRNSVLDAYKEIMNMQY